MKTKTLSAFLALAFVLLLTSSALGAITVTWATPSNGSVYNNTYNNRKTIDLNWGWTDSNNNAGNDLDFNLFVRHEGATWAYLTLLHDQNIYDANISPTATLRCDVLNVVGTSGSCIYHWVMPLDVEMPNGHYCLDVNVAEIRNLAGTVPDTYSADQNATVCFNINNGLATAASTRGMLMIIGIVVAAGILIVGVLAIGLMNADPTKIVIAMVIGGIAAAILLMLLGTFTGMIV